MENYIVIILTIIIIIAGAVGRNKRKTILQPHEEESFIPSNPWGIMEELRVQPPIHQPVKNIEIMEAPEKNPLYGFTAKEEGGSILKDSILKSELNLKKTNTSDNIKEFSLKEAVIYSEILNRKYI